MTASRRRAAAAVAGGARAVAAARAGSGSDRRAAALRDEGAIKRNTYSQFIGAMGCKALSLCLLTGVIGYFLMLYADFWLARWMKDPDGLSDPAPRTCTWARTWGWLWRMCSSCS